MKRKVERYIYTKNIGGCHKLIDSDGNLLIGDDIDGCVRAARSQVPITATDVASASPVTIQVGSHPTAAPTPTTTSRKKRKTELNSLFSPAVAPKIASKAGTPVSSATDKQELLDFCRTLRGGYVKGIYRSAIERRKMAESTTVSGLAITKALNDLNLTNEERDRLPPFFKENVLPKLDVYSAPPPASTRKAPSVKKEYSTPFQVGAATPNYKPIMSQLQLRPSPVMTKKERDAALDAAFLAFSPAPQIKTEESDTTTPCRSPVHGGGSIPGSAFSSFSPFMSPNYTDSIMQGMAMTPAIIQSSGDGLMAPTSWEENVFDDTPNSAKGEVEIEVGPSNSGPWLPTAEELASAKKSVDIDAQLEAVGATDDHSLHVSIGC